MRAMKTSAENPWLKRFLIGCTVFTLLIILGKTAGLHLNLTASYPRGIWIETGLYDPVRVGHPYVLACAPQAPLKAAFIERGYLAWGIDCEGTVALLKQVWGRAGDRWSLSADGVRLNEKLVSNTQPLEMDGAGREMPVPQAGTIPAGHVLLLSEYHSGSLDGRYFGTTPITDLIAEVKPLWTESH